MIDGYTFLLNSGLVITALAAIQPLKEYAAYWFNDLARLHGVQYQQSPLAELSTFVAMLFGIGSATLLLLSFISNHY